MWKRRQLKRNAKSALRRNYWRCVLAAVILASITGSFSGVIGGSIGAASGGMVGYSYIPESQTEEVGALPEGTDIEDVNDGKNVTEQFSELTGVAESAAADGETATWDDVMDLIARMPEVQEASQQLSELDEDDLPIILAIVGGVVGAILLCVFLVQLLIINPMYAGCKYFFARNSREKTMVGEVAGGFDRGYGRVVKGMFLKDLFLIFWTLLFIIPGIIKSFSYRMVPYILVDQPELTATQAITRSRQMMKGNKWRAFVLDLSFILWYLLSGLTLGLLGLFFVHPYYEATNAELYQALKNAPVDDGYDDDRYDEEDSYDEAPQDLPQELPEQLPQEQPADVPQELPGDLPEQPPEA